MPQIIFKKRLDSSNQKESKINSNINNSTTKLIKIQQIEKKQQSPIDSQNKQISNNNEQNSQQQLKQLNNNANNNNQRVPVLSKNGSRSSSANPMSMNNKQIRSQSSIGITNSQQKLQQHIIQQQQVLQQQQQYNRYKQDNQQIVNNQQTRLKDFQLYKDQNIMNQNNNDNLQQKQFFINNNLDSTFDYNANTFGMINNSKYNLNLNLNTNKSFYNNNNQQILYQNNNVFYDNQLSPIMNNSLLMPTSLQNMAVKQRQQELDKTTDKLVLYDPHRMFRGEQNLRIQDLLKSGKSSLTVANLRQQRNRLNSTSATTTGKTANYNLINAKYLSNNNNNNNTSLDPNATLKLNQSLIVKSSSSGNYNKLSNKHQNTDNIDITQHLIAFSNSLKPFYKQSKIVPETQLDEQHRNKDCYVLQVLPKSCSSQQQQQQQRRNIRTATTALSYNTQSQQMMLRNRVLSSEIGMHDMPSIGIAPSTAVGRYSIPLQFDQNNILSNNNISNNIHVMQNEFDMYSHNNQNVTQQQNYPQIKNATDSTVIDMNQGQQQDLITLRRKFEDNETNIIHDLYSKHFQHKNTNTNINNIQDNQNTLRAVNNVINNNTNNGSNLQSRQILDNYLTNPNESLTFSENKTLSAKRLQELNENLEGYEKIKYVQYVPKNQMQDVQETGINQMFLQGEPITYHPHSLNTTLAHNNNINTQILNDSMTIAEHRCLTSHQHARRCNQYKDLDVADLQNKAFQQLKVVNKQVYEKNSNQQENSNNKLYKASFFPTSQMPEELIQILKETKDFQKTMQMDDKLLVSKPDKYANTQSRFHQRNAKSNSPTFHLNQLKVLSDYLQQNPQNQNIQDNQMRNALIAFRRNQLAQKVQIKQEVKENQINNNDQYLSIKEQESSDNQDQSQKLKVINSDLRQLAESQNSQILNRNLYYPKVSILNNFNGWSQDSKLTNQQLQNLISSQDFSQTPISQHALKLNIEKECVKYHQKNVSQGRESMQIAKYDSEVLPQKNIILTSKTPSEDGLLLNQLSPYHQNDNNKINEQKRLSLGINDKRNSMENSLTQQIFKPRNHLLSDRGSSRMLSPNYNQQNATQNKKLQNQKQQNTQGKQSVMKDKQNQFFNFNEINKLQKKKWQSPFIHQKNCDMNKRLNLQSNELHNFEKSNKVQLAQSLNSQVNNPYQLWNRNPNKSNYQTRKREVLHSSVVEEQQYDHSRILSNSPDKQQTRSNEHSQMQQSKYLKKTMPSSLMAFKVKKYQRPNTTHFQKRIDKKQSAKGISTLDFANEQMQNYLSLIGQSNNPNHNGTFILENNQPNNQLRFETESLSMSSGNIHMTTGNNQQSSSNNLQIQNSVNKLDGNKRLIISKRSGDIYKPKKKKKSSSRLLFNDLNSTTFINRDNSGNLEIDRNAY